VWWEILYGAVSLLLAAYFWRRGLRQDIHVSSGT
jgi:hypothetical protein